MVLVMAACGSTEAPSVRSRVTTDAGQQADDAIRQRLESVTILMEQFEEGETRAEVEVLAREIALLTRDPMFDPWPLTRAKLGTQALFLVADDADARTRALKRCTTLIQDMNQTADGRGGRP